MSMVSFKVCAHFLCLYDLRSCNKIFKKKRQTDEVCVMDCAAMQKKRHLSPFSFCPPFQFYLHSSVGKLRKARWGSFQTRACFHFMFNFLMPKPPGFPTLLLQPRRGVPTRKGGRIPSLLCSRLSELEHASQVRGV